MMTVIPTRRPWITPGRVMLAVVLLALGSGAVLSTTETEATVLACVASAR